MNCGYHLPCFCRTHGAITRWSWPWNPECSNSREALQFLRRYRFPLRSGRKVGAVQTKFPAEADWILMPMGGSIFFIWEAGMDVPSTLFTRDKRRSDLSLFYFFRIHIDGTATNNSSRKFCQQHRRPVCCEERSVRVRSPFKPAGRVRGNPQDALLFSECLFVQSRRSR